MLTDEERKIAEENHNLIYFFINHFNVDIDEYYDIFAIDYIKCVKFWDKDRGKLSTLLCKVFLNTIIKEKRKKKKKESNMNIFYKIIKYSIFLY